MQGIGSNPYQCTSLTRHSPECVYGPAAVYAIVKQPLKDRR